MCHQIYLATSEAIHPTRLENQPLKVSLLNEDNYRWEGLRSKFSLPYIYTVNSSTGCSCALHKYSVEEEISVFQYPELETSPGMEEIDAFYNLLIGEACKGPAELYTCWDGDENEPINESLVLEAVRLTEDNIYLATEERRFFSIGQISSPDIISEPIRFMNVDLDIEAPEHPQLLMDFFKNWVILVHPDDTGMPLIRYEHTAHMTDPETTILAFCEDLEQMPENISAFWFSCPVRCLDIGYQCGSEDPVLVNSFSSNTLQLVAAFFTELKITMYHCS